VFINDTPLDPDACTIGKVLKAQGYSTAYIGKWHVDGHGRLNPIPPERRQGFDYWKVCECTHDYGESLYYGDSPDPRHWDGYDACAQTQDALAYLREHAGDAAPFALFLSWGPPHNPYATAPQQYQEMYDPAALRLRPNVPAEHEENARKTLAGYYAHITALDDCMGELLAGMEELGLAEEALLVFTSDHGDMVGTRGSWDKQQPFEESLRVPFLLRYPALLGRQRCEQTIPIDAPDIMPTLLGLTGIPVPASVEGQDISPLLRGEEHRLDPTAFLLCPHPFGNWHRGVGGKEYRGVRTERHTYVRDLNGPWLLYDNHSDPYQLTNLCGVREHAGLQEALEQTLQRKLRERRDEFLPGDELCKRHGFVTSERGTVVARNG
jgi:arylsulfatase A-like enzyme